MKIAVVFERTDRTKMDVTQEHLEMVGSAIPGAQVLRCFDPGELIDKSYNADILICWATGGLFTCEEYCNFATNLKWIHALSAGVEGFLTANITGRPGLRLTNAKGIHGIPISETVMGYILSVTRELPRVKVNQATRLWESFTPEEIYMKTICILGAGSIGGEIAKRCKAFDMNVLGVRRKAADTPYFDRVYSTSGMHEAIAVSDFVVMVMPATPDTDKIFNMELFALMKETAFFINVGRGMTVDTDALVIALSEKRIKGAMLDAFDEEPLPTNHPLWSLDNVFLSPHMSASTPQYMDRAIQVFTQNAPAFLAGKIMPTEIPLMGGG